MADLDVKRIINFTTQSTLSDGDYVAVDSTGNGTKKYNLGGLLQPATTSTPGLMSSQDKAALNQAGSDITDLKGDINEHNYIFSPVAGEYVDVFDSGKFKAYASFSRTDYIKTGTVDRLTIISGGASQYNAFYDSEKSYISKFTLASGTNYIDVPANAVYFAISEATADLQNTTIKNECYYVANKLNKISESMPSLADTNDVIIGKNWTQGSAANRAILWVDCKPQTEYILKLPANSAFNDISVVQKSTKSGVSLGSATYNNNSTNVFTTVANAVLLCIQFNGLTTITSSDFDDYSIYVAETGDLYTAVDEYARNEIEGAEKKKYIFIGDSYCEGYNPDGNVTGWGNRLKTAMNLTDENCIIKYQGGTGFYHVSSGKTFSTLLDEAGAEVIKNSITDIVVCGGWNDNSEAVGNVYSAVLAFIAKVRNEYPNAKLYIGMIGASNDSTVKTRLQNTVLYAYQYGALADICTYLNNVEYALSESNLASDGIHPKADGQVQITIAIKQAIETGTAYIPFRFYNQIKTS